MNWYLRKSDSTIYGPVEESTLVAWAASGRVTPDDQVSSDRENWRLAPALPALCMEWLLDLGDGERFGPLHPLALLELVRDGSLTAGQSVIHVSAGTRCSLGEAVLPTLLAIPPPAPDPELARLRQALADAETRLRELEARPPAAPVADPELPRLRAALADAEARLSKPAPPPPPPAVDDAELTRLRQALAGAEERIRELEGHLRALEARPAPAPAAPAPSPDLETLLKSFRDLSTNYDHLLEQLKGKGEELAHLLDSHGAIKRDLEAQLAESRQLAQHARTDAEQALQKLAQHEQAHLDVIKSYRDLNDRYIRLRQQYADQPPAAVPARPKDKPVARLV